MTTTTRTETEPAWHSLSHHERYKTLQEVRQQWCQRPSCNSEDVRGRTVRLNGTWINDVAGFYLSLGESVNGANGYFGGDLDALSDCLCGGFGVLPPLTIHFSRFDEVRRALDARAWVRFRAECFYDVSVQEDSRELLLDNGYLGDGSESDIAWWTATYKAALAGEPLDVGMFNSYFDALVEVLENGGAKIVPETVQ